MSHYIVQINRFEINEGKEAGGAVTAQKPLG